MPVAARPTDVPVAVLSDYYEHIIEHTPPRDPSGAMQRRERFYTAPHDPFESMRSGLGAGAPDAQFRTKLDTWGRSFRQGNTDPEGLEDLTWLAERSSLSAAVLLDAARAFDFLAGDKAAALFDAALDKATEKYKNTQAGDPSTLHFLHALDQTKALWRVRDYVGLEKRFALAMALYPPLSVESRRAGVLYAEALYSENRPQDAVDAIMKVWQQDKYVGDLGTLEKSDISEMNWMAANCLFAAQRFDAAIPYYEAFLKTDDSRKRDGATFLIMCLRNTGRTQAIGRVQREYGLTPQDPITGQAVVALRPRTETGDDERQTIASIRSELQSNPAHAIDQLNESGSVALLQSKQYAAVEEFATAGTLALPADTWRIEQLQKHRIEALLAENKPTEALAAAKGLFNVCGMGFTKDALPLLADCLKAAHPDDPGLVPNWKLQVLANAQEDPAERRRLLAKYGGNSVMDSIPADPSPYAKAIAARKGITDYRGMYGTGNLLLLAGRVKEAHDVFAKVYQIAPPEELKYASEGIAKMIKAEEGGLGKANQFVISIRPR